MIASRNPGIRSQKIDINTDSPVSVCRPYYPAFTLIELLITIAIIAILTAILLPALAAAKERGRRTVCLNHVHQFIVGIHFYADENRDNLPSGLSDNFNEEDEHTPVISTPTRAALIKAIGDERFLICPSMGEPFTQPGGWYYPHYGYIIGYNYLGGHQGTPWPLIDMANTEWISPQKITDKSSTPVVTELNAWSWGGNMTFAPHGPRGAVDSAGDFSNPSEGGIPSEDIGAAGGNVGLLDGSVSWKQIHNMQIYRGSHYHGSAGCFTAW